MKASDYIARYLSQRGVRYAFEVSGGMIAHLLDSIFQEGRIRLVSVHHEQAAAFAAEAVGRMTGIPGVALATSGPGTDLLTGIGSCYFDSSPAIFITGQVNRHEQKGSRKIRQLGFQEADIAAMAAPITKAAWKVGSVQALPGLLDRAFALATSGRPGPVLLDIPMDIQCQELASSAAPQRAPAPTAPPDPAAVRSTLEKLRDARRPLLLIGGGIRSARAAEPLVRLAAILKIPVAASLMALDVLPYDHPLRVGMIGAYGNRWANMALGDCDCLLVLGSRLDVRQTGGDTEAFMAHRSVIHVDCEPGEINNRLKGCDSIVSELPAFLDAALRLAPDLGFTARAPWLKAIADWRAEWPDTHEQADGPGINPNLLMHRLSAQSADASAFVVDVGQHQMWAAQSLDIRAGQRLLTSGGMGAMGFALPAAIGAAVCSQRPVVAIAGDGGFQCNLQELQTVVRNRLPIKIVIVNNNCHGMVRQFQERYFDGRYPSTLWGYDAPDFTAIARAYGIRATTVADPGEIDDAVVQLWRDPGEPALLQVMVDTCANVYPKVAFGQPITEMERREATATARASAAGPPLQ